MGLVLLDLTFRVEKAFKVHIPQEDWPARLGLFEAGDDITLAAYHEIVMQLCEVQGVSAPTDGWNKIQKCVSNASGLDERDVTGDLCLIKDIAPNG